MRLFGSVAADNHHEGSDVDLLVDMPASFYLYPNLDLNQDGDVTVSDLVTLIRILTRKVAV